MRLLLFIFLTAFFTTILTFGSYMAFNAYLNPLTFQPTPTPTIKPKPLQKYTIENLAQRTATPSAIILDEAVATTSAYTKYVFHFMSEGKKVTGLATVPIRNSLSPVIIQFRGYVDRSIYKPGVGTSRSGEVFANNGFITLAPDFLGYGESDMPSTDVFEERFQTYTVALDLLASVKSLPFADAERIALWGHSNGGHIALTIAEILKTTMPVTVWAPVTKYFPYSILYFTDEADDGGRALRKELARFEADYNTDDFTLAKHIDRLEAPLQIHQGTADEAVPQKWSDEFVNNVKNIDKDIEYFVYPGADHNMLGAWNTVVERDLQFFAKYLKK